MIFHASIPASNPENTARVIAELWGGMATPFPAFPDSWMAIANDGRGTIIETYPADRTIDPGPGGESFVAGTAARATYSAFHMAIATTLTADQVMAIGEREGWRTLQCTRGQDFFDVIELWIDNVTLLEVLTTDMQTDYLAFTSPQNFGVFARPGATAASPSSLA